MHTKRFVPVVSLSLAMILVSGCIFKKHRSEIGNQSSLSSTEIQMDPLYQLTFVPSSDFPQNIQFIVKNSVNEYPNFKISAVNTAGQDISDALAKPQMMPREVSPGRWDVAVAIPFTLNEKTLIGFKTIIQLAGVQDLEGKEIKKEQVFELKEGAYPLDHVSQDSPLADFGVVNEFLLPANRSSLDLANYIQELLTSAGLGQQQEAERARIRARLEFTESEGKKIISLKGNLAISYTFPGEIIIRTNGYKLKLLGGDYSKVTVEVGVKQNVRQSGSPQNPEISADTLKPPQFTNQINKDESGATYPASQGHRGAKADLNRCNTLISKITQNIDGFPGNRAKCENQMSTLNGLYADLDLTFSFSDEDVPVTPDAGVPLANLVSLKNAAGESIFLDANGAPCVFNDSEQAKDSCAFTNFNRSFVERKDLNEGDEFKAYLQANHAAKILPDLNSVSASGYSGPGSIVSSKIDRENTTEKPGGAIVATPVFDESNPDFYGYKGAWIKDGTAYNAIANSCLNEIRSKSSVQDTVVPGAEADESAKINGEKMELQKVGFQTAFPGLTLVDSVSFSSRVKTTANPTPAAPTSTLNCTLPVGRGGSLKIASSDNGEFITLGGKKIFRFKESARNAMRPLAKNISILGEPGKNGFDAPAVTLSFPSDIPELEFLKQYETLAGSAGLPGFALGFPKSEITPLSTGQFKMNLLDSELSTQVANIDEHLLQQYCIKVTRDEAGQPSSLEYYPVAASFPVGNEVKYEYSRGMAKGEAQAAFDLYSRITGLIKLNSIPSLEVLTSTDMPGQGNVQGFSGGIRVGAKANATSALSGFWGFNRGSAPQPFLNGYMPREDGGSGPGKEDRYARETSKRSYEKDYDGNSDSKAEKAKKEKESNVEKMRKAAELVKQVIENTYESMKNEIENKIKEVVENLKKSNSGSESSAQELRRQLLAGGADDAPITRSKQLIPNSMRSYSFVEEFSCTQLPVFSGSKIDKDGYSQLEIDAAQWKIKTAVTKWITDANYPECGKENGSFIHPQKCQSELRSFTDDSLFFEENGTNYLKYSQFRDQYVAQLELKCSDSPLVAQAIQAKIQGEANVAFSNKCNENSDCLAVKNSIAHIAQILANRQNPLELKNRLISDEIYANSSLVDLENHQKKAQSSLSQFENAFHKSEVKSMSPQISKVFQDMKYQNGQEIRTLEDLSRAIAEYAIFIANMREVARPGIRNNTLPSCQYSVSGGNFRKYHQAQLTSQLTTQSHHLAKISNVSTALTAGYSYPKTGGSTVVDAIQKPDLIPLSGNNETLVLKDPDTAKPGIASQFSRALIKDCADIANLARKQTMPLPRNLFISAECKKAKLVVN